MADFLLHLVVNRPNDRLSAVLVTAVATVAHAVVDATWRYPSASWGADKVGVDTGTGRRFVRTVRAIAVIVIQPNKQQKIDSVVIQLIRIPLGSDIISF